MKLCSHCITQHAQQLMPLSLSCTARLRRQPTCRIPQNVLSASAVIVNTCLGSGPGCCIAGAAVPVPADVPAIISSGPSEKTVA